MWDVMVPKESTGKWKCLLQTNVKNQNDGDIFIDKQNRIGCKDGLDGYSKDSLEPGRWYRIVFRTDATKERSIWVNGKKWLTCHTGRIDGRYSLDRTFHIGADNSGEDALIHIANVKMWSKVLTDDQIVLLGTPLSPGERAEKPVPGKRPGPAPAPKPKTPAGKPPKPSPSPAPSTPRTPPANTEVHTKPVEVIVGRNFQKCIQDKVIPWEEMKTLTICGIEPQKGNNPVKLHMFNGYTAEDFIAILKPKASTDKLEPSMGNHSWQYKAKGKRLWWFEGTFNYMILDGRRLVLLYHAKHDAQNQMNTGAYLKRVLFKREIYFNPEIDF
jgi:hypothetical protein